MRTIYGVNPVLEALRRAPHDIKAVFVSRADSARIHPDLTRLMRDVNLRPQSLDPRAMSQKCATTDHQDIAALLPDFAYADPDTLLHSLKAPSAAPRRIIVALDGVQDPRNLGAILRSAAAFGALAVVIPKDRSASITPAAEKAAAGASLFLPVARVTNLTRFLEDAKSAGAWVYGTAMSAPPVADAPRNEPLVLVMGGEGDGLRPGVAKACDIMVSIPMAGPTESLNVSVAAAILLYDLALR